jgi:hypothetical protein
MKKSRSIVGIAVVVSSVVLIGAGMLAHRAIEQLSANNDAVLRAKAMELGDCCTRCVTRKPASAATYSPMKKATCTPMKQRCRNWRSAWAG